ncbi:MAG: DoxX family protein [Verrucomicrobiota bacterium JB023]|nr:DoxX family protein [Verrucomicrobiota bacterium JB023]
MTNWILALLTIIMLAKFGFPKLMGDPVSVKGFNDFSPALGLDPDGFRIFTGVAELTNALLLLVSLFLVRFRIWLLAIGYGLTLSTMVSGLLIEFFAREEPKMPLVVIAVVFILISAFQLRIPFNHYLSRRRGARTG